MPLGRKEDRRAIRRQLRRDISRQVGGTVLGASLGGGLGYLAGSRLTRPLQALHRFGRVGQAIAKWGPAAVGGKIGTALAGAYAGGKSLRENRRLAAEVGVSKSVASYKRLPFYQLGYPPALDVRRAYRRKHA